jgi:hypothetical protein
MDESASRAESQHVVAANLVEISLLTPCDDQIDGDAITQVGPARSRRLAEKTERFIGQNELVIEPTPPCLQSGEPYLLNLAGADATR